MSRIDDEWQLVNGIYRKVERDEDAGESKEPPKVEQWFYRAYGSIRNIYSDVTNDEQANEQD